MTTMKESVQKLVEEVQKWSKKFALASLAKKDDAETEANDAKHLAMHECYKFCRIHSESLKGEYEKANKEDYNHYLIVLTFLYKYAQTWLHDEFFLRKMSLKNYEKAYKKFVVPEGVEKFRF